jgi:outer membrane protein TolC
LVVGKGQQADVLRTQVELSNLESELVVLRQRRITNVSLLNSLLDRPVATPVATPPDYDLRRLEMRLDHLLDFAMAENPELQLLERRIARAEQGVKLSRLAYWPDFTIGLEWMPIDPRGAFRPPINAQTGMRPRVPQMSEDGSDNWAILFGFNIPLWSQKIEAGIREAEHKLAASRRKHASTKNRVTFGVEDALARVRSSRDIANLFATAIIPQAQQAYIVSRTNYVAGSSDFQYVIDNWRRWLFFRIRYYHTLGEVERNVADLEQVVGVSIVEVEERAGAPVSGP